MKTLEEYLQLPYTIEVVHDQSGEEPGWFARVVELSGCMTQTDTFEELEAMLQDAMRAWLTTALAAGIPIPEPNSAAEYSGQLKVHVPRSLHKELAIAAAHEGVSLNTFVAVTLSRSLGSTASTRAVPAMGN